MIEKIKKALEQKQPQRRTEFVEILCKFNLQKMEFTRVYFHGCFQGIQARLKIDGKTHILPAKDETYSVEEHSFIPCPAIYKGMETA